MILRVDLVLHRCARFLVLTVSLLLCLGGAGNGFVYAQPEATEDARPNLLVVYVDDLDRTPLGLMDDPIIQTPHIDRLAEQGVAFRNAFVTTAICVTSRGNLMTGRYAARTGIYMEGFERLSEEQGAMTYPAQLRAAGYYTGYVGKWHLGEAPEGLFDNDQSFSGQGRFWSDEEPPDGGTHLTSRLGDQTADMIRDAPDDRPFAITVGFKAPHVQDGFYPVEPYPPMPSVATLYELDAMPAPPLSDSAFFASQPPFIQTSLGRERWHYRLGPPESLNFQRSLRRYYRMVTGVDRQVGKIVGALRERGRLENTVIVFTSDHGMYLGERGLAGKWLGHDTSIRIPLIVYDPRIPEAERGAWREEMVLMIDLHPTLLDWAGLSPDDGVQGVSFAPVVTGSSPDDWRSEFYYEHHSFGDRIPRSEGIRTERYKYLRYIDTTPVFEELYDLEADPIEQNNLADDPAHQALLEEMRSKWERWHKAVR